MIFAEFIGALVVAIIIGSLFYYGFKRTGPWGSSWSFFLVLFLGIWMLGIWTDPYGPEYWSIAWFDFIFVGLLFAFLMAAATPDFRRRKPKTEDTAIAEGVVAISIFFWFLILFFLIAIILGLLV